MFVEYKRIEFMSAMFNSQVPKICSQRVMVEHTYVSHSIRVNIGSIRTYRSTLFMNTTRVHRLAVIHICHDSYVQQTQQATSRSFK
jgi:hypothetical protein